MSVWYKLALVAQDGTLVDSWTVGDADNDDADVIYPITKLGPASLAEDINRAIARAKGE